MNRMNGRFGSALCGKRTIASLAAIGSVVAGALAAPGDERERPVKPCATQIGQNVATQDSHPMAPNTEAQFAEMTQAQKDSLVPQRNDRGGPTICSGSGLGLLYPFNRSNTTGWTSALARSDDGSSVQINLGFTFQFYGTNYTSCFINNNGNITFGAAYSPYVPTGFPSATVPPMIAPFWADVDTRNVITGQVWYKIIDSNNGGLPDTLVVTWDNVSYFANHSDLLNTFQLVISNFTNPDMQPGSNVCFDYDQMCWTTGDINSVANNGFTDPPSATTGNATAGINKGDGVSYFQVGRFGVAGSSYDGPFGGADGINYLSNKRFCFNTSTGNVPPVAAGIPAANTYNVNAGQTLDATLQFLSPEFGQVTTVSFTDQDGAVAAGLVVTPTSGNVGAIRLQWPTGCNDVGQYTLTVTARDNFVPQGITTVTLNIRVNEVNTSPIVSITNPAPFAGVCTTVNIVGTATSNNTLLFDSYTLAYSTNPAGPWTTFATNANQVSGGVLGIWNTAGLAQGYYFIRLRAQNFCGPFSEFITVLAKCGPPNIVVEPVAQSATDSERICLSVGDSEFCGASYQWQRNGVNLTNGGRFSGVNTANLMISPVQRSDAGSYRVILTNACGTDTSLAVPVSVFCRADFNKSNAIGAQDIFDFLFAWFAPCP